MRRWAVEAGTTDKAIYAWQHGRAEPRHPRLPMPHQPSQAMYEAALTSVYRCASAFSFFRRSFSSCSACRV